MEKQIKKFSIAMFLIALVIMVAAAFVMPKVAFATTASNSSSGNLTINYSVADYTVVPVAEGEYIILPGVGALKDDFEVEATTATGSKLTAKTVKEEVSTDPSDPLTKVKMFLVGNVSSYKVVYKLTSGAKDATQTISVDLEKKDSSFKFENNSEQIIPAYVQKTEQKAIAFPYPFIYVGEESETPINVDSETKKPTEVAGLTVTLTSPSATQVTEAQGFKKNTETGYYEFKMPEDVQTGKYTLRYTYKNTSAQTVVKSFNFTVKENPVEQAIKIDEFSKSLPSTIVMFEEAELPKPVVVNTKNSNAEVSAYTKLYLTFTPFNKDEEDKATIYTNDISKKGTEGYTYEASLNEFKFTPTLKGSFTAKYVVVDFFGNTAETSSKVGAITSVKTNSSGSGYIVEQYDDFNTEKALIESGDFQTAEYKIPTKVKVASDVEWSLPAIFGVDKLTTDSSKLNYTRTIEFKKSDNTTVFITFKESGANIKEQPADHIYTEGGTYRAKPNETIPFKFAEESEYKVTYKVTDSEGCELLNESYKVDAKKDYTDTNNPTVKFDGLYTTTVEAGKVFKFKVIGTDTISSTDATVADSRLKIDVTKKIGGNTTTIYADSEGYYTLDTTGVNGDIEVTAVATDDFGLDAQNTKTITVKQITGDATPTATDFDFTETPGGWTISGNELQTVKAGAELSLPEVTFTDGNTTPNSNLSVDIIAKVGSKVVYRSSANSGHDTTLTLGGETLTVSRSGDYVVNYVATNARGNKLVKSFEFTVVGPEKTIINLGSFENSYEYGDEIDLRNLKVTLQTSTGSEDITDECALITDISATASAADIRTKAENAAANPAYPGGAILCQIIGNYSTTGDESTIKAGQNGSVTINYWAVGHWTTGFDENFTAEPKTVTFTVKDTKGPTLQINEDLIEDVVDYDSSKTGLYDNIVKIADFTKIWDLSDIDEESVKITAKSGSTELDLVKFKGKFVATNEQYYIINNKIIVNSKEYTYDETAKTLKYADETPIAIVDNKVTLDGTEYTLVDETEYYGYFKATANGSITLTYTASDLMGNSSTKTYTFVVGDITPPEINTQALQTAVNNKDFKEGDTITLNLSDLVFSDAKTKEDVLKDRLSVSATCDGEAVDVTISEDKKTATFKASKYGKYVVSFSTKDDAGYSTTEDVSFSISNNNNGKTTSSTTVWGTVLIVVILVALGVIIFLFAKPSKQKQTVKLSDKKDDKKNDKIEV